jgi:hypothetical protein
MATATVLYNKTLARRRITWTATPAARITKPMATGGRPTDDPKGTLIAVRLPARHVQLLEQRSRRENTGISEAMRRCLDDWAAAHATRSRLTTRAKPATIKPPTSTSPTRPAPRRTRQSPT